MFSRENTALSVEELNAIHVGPFQKFSRYGLSVASRVIADQATVAEMNIFSSEDKKIARILLQLDEPIDDLTDERLFVGS